MAEGPRMTKIRPFLRWSGGKTRLIPELLKKVPSQFDRYHEPFLGSGALFWALINARKIDHDAEVYLNDANQWLIAAWAGVRHDVERVIDLLRIYRDHHSPEFYLGLRGCLPALSDICTVASWVIYLNRTAFNGLWRVNKNGVFNTPIDKTRTKESITNPEYEENLRQCSFILNQLKITLTDDPVFADGIFSPLMRPEDSRDFVYLDPPYIPVSKTANFTAFTKQGFKERDHRNLAAQAQYLRNRGCRVLVSQSNVPLIRGLYEGFTIEEVFTKRSISAKASSRGLCSELLISSPSS